MQNIYLPQTDIADSPDNTRHHQSLVVLMLEKHKAIYKGYGKNLLKS